MQHRSQHGARPFTPTAGSVVSVRGVTHIYGHGHTAVTALAMVDLEVPPRTFVAITGRSGSGKTTLLNLIGGLDTPTQGCISIEGRAITDLDERARTDLRRHTIGFVFQSFALLPTLSALENVALALHIAGVGAGERYRRAREVLGQVGLSERSDHRSFELSGGEQERVAVARALANHPALVLADEPTGELDTATSHEIIILLSRLVATTGVTVIVATHDPAVTAEADQVYHIGDGVLKRIK